MKAKLLYLVLVVVEIILEVESSLLTPADSKLNKNLLQQATLFSEASGHGYKTLLAVLHEPEMRDRLGGVKSLSGNVTGVWLFYSAPNFGINHTFSFDVLGYGMEYFYSESPGKLFNFTFIGGHIRSARYAGISFDYSESSITFYPKTFFQGLQRQFVEDQGSVGLHAFSAIITGGSSWALYSEENFGGTSVCLVPPASGPGFIEHFVDLKTFVWIRSVRQGCGSDVRRYLKLKFRRQGSNKYHTWNYQSVEVKKEEEPWRVVKPNKVYAIVRWLGLLGVLPRLF